MKAQSHPNQTFLILILRVLSDTPYIQLDFFIRFQLQMKDSFSSCNDSP
jgi:hypothetical protein